MDANEQSPFGEVEEISSSQLLTPHSPVPSNPQSPESIQDKNEADLSLTDPQDPDDGFQDEVNHRNEDSHSKRRSDEGLELRDELDFEEADKESGEEGEESDNEQEEKKPFNREEGELSEEEEEDPSLRQEPKTVCRFFNKGQCTWGTNCRFLHPGVSDKGNYNMFAPAKAVCTTEIEEEPPSEKERVCFSDISETQKKMPRELRRFVPEPSPFESAWERGLRHAKEMMKRASKRKETDADFEEKRFNLSLGQAELDRENDYYTRPASPIYKSDEVIEYLDPYERQAIRHFRGGHFENFEVRYKVDPAYPARVGHMRSRRDKYEREVTERIPRKARVPSPIEADRIPATKEKRYPRPRPWNEGGREDGDDDVPVTKGEAEVWADPWARRKTPVRRTKKRRKVSHTPRSYSSGSSSNRSSRSSRSSSFSSYSRSRSSSKSSRSRSSSRSITPPIHPRQRGLLKGRGGIHRGQQNNINATGLPLNRRLDPREGRDIKERLLIPKTEPRQDNKRPANLRKTEPKPPPEIHQRLTNQRKLDPKHAQTDLHQRPAAIPRKLEPKSAPNEPPERVDMFGRTIRKDVPRSPSRSRSKSLTRPRGRFRKYSSSRSRSRSGSRSSFSTRTRSRTRSHSRSSSSSSGSSSPASSPTSHRRERNTKMTQGTVSYGDAPKVMKSIATKQGAKVSIKKLGTTRTAEKVPVPVEDDSGESDVDARILKKRKIDAPLSDPPPLKAKRPSPSLVSALIKKPMGGRREELLKQLRAVEDAIARKRGKNTL